MADVNLTQQDIDYIARVVDTEVPASLARTNPREYERMVQGVVDTVTNRMVSDAYPDTVTGVANQSRQFSKITGPARLNPYGAVQHAPQASPRARAAVDDYVAARALGAPPTAPGALNYANPNFSDPSNLRGWINPMIEAGAVALGMGRNVHYHGTVPGQEPVGYYTLAAEAMPSTAVPTPTPRDAIQPAYGIMAAIDPPTVTPVERGLLGPVTETASLAASPAGSVQRGALLGPPSADAPVQSSFPSLDTTSRFATVQDFDASRFGSAVQTPTAPSSVMDRFADVQPVAQGMAGLRSAMAPAFDTARFGAPVTSPTPVDASVSSLQRGLLDQALAMGHLPNMPTAAAPGALLGAPAIDPVTTTAATPGYIDPALSVQPQVTQPAPEPFQAAPAAPAQPAISAAQQTFNERSALGAPAPSALGPQMARDVQSQMATRNTIGALGGALLGGALLGPVGGILGGMMGRNYTQRNYSPPAPEPIAGQPQQSFTRGQSSFGNLNEYGRETYSSSRDFRDAVDSGSAGLW